MQNGRGRPGSIFCACILRPVKLFRFTNIQNSNTGADPEIEEGRGICIEWGVVRRTQCVVVCVHIAHSVVGGSGGMLPKEIWTICECF